jgi:hypothetical protein
MLDFDRERSRAAALHVCGDPENIAFSGAGHAARTNKSV